MNNNYLRTLYRIADHFTVEVCQARRLIGTDPGINQAEPYGNFTLFAPTNAAWLALDSDFLEFLAHPVKLLRSNTSMRRNIIVHQCFDGVFTLAKCVPSRISNWVND
jgi:uncharacterized surface protein with fasciclin (FAS1) repeats